MLVVIVVPALLTKMYSIFLLAWRLVVVSLENQVGPGLAQFFNVLAATRSWFMQSSAKECPLGVHRVAPAEPSQGEHGSEPTCPFASTPTILVCRLPTLPA